MKIYNTPDVKILTFNALDDVLNVSENQSLAKLYDVNEHSIQDRDNW